MTWLKQYVDPKVNSSRKLRNKNEERGFHDFRQIETFFAEEILDEVYMVTC